MESPQELHTFDESIFELNSEQRTAVFEEIYLINFGHFANPRREQARQQALSRVLKSFGAKLEEQMETNAKKMGRAAALQLIKNQVNLLVAREVAKGTIGGVTDQFGRRMAVVMAESAAGRIGTAAAVNQAVHSGGSAAINGAKIFANAGKLAGFVPNISAVIGQAVAETWSDSMGVENHHAKNIISVSGAAAGGATAGGIMGGPPGAAVGALVGVASWGIGKGIDAVISSRLLGEGPGNNWAYVKTGRLREELCFSSYNKRDTIYMKSFESNYKRSNCDMFVTSAGQKQNDHFQLTVYHNSQTVVHLKRVHYRDFVFVAMNRSGHITVAIGKGEFGGNEAGIVKIERD